ncbi:glycosyl hydrolase family 28 protein [Streptomyces sp900116325]|uniref:glycoside hydrolase family 28 protein n=1 Tax=Streptomyces sp. 900116325 TaxID=3154295 RepID=UPI0033289804
MTVSQRAAATAHTPVREHRRAGGPPVFSVDRFGAVADGRTKDTAAIQAAIDAAHAAGGGVAHLPPGTYLSGGIELRSRVTLHLEAGAVLLGSTDLTDYPPHEGPPADCDAGQRHLVFARGATDIAITGAGTIDGQGPAFWEPSGRPPTPPDRFWADVVTHNWKPVGNNDRPSPMVELAECRNVRIEGVTLRNSPGWTLRPIACDTVMIRGIVIRNPIDGINTDGIDPTGCQNVFIADCDIETGDDAICLKSENPYGDLRVTRNVVVTNCVLSCCCNAFKLGTATRGGFEDITFTNSVIYNRDVPLNERVISGIAIEMVDGGWVDGVSVSGIRMRNTRTPVFIRLGNRGWGQPDPAPGRLRRVRISGIDATGAILTSSITGLAEQPVEDVVLSGIRIDTDEGGRREWVERNIPEEIAEYPEARMFGRLPAYGLYVRHAHGIRISGTEIRSTVPDPRPLLVADDVVGLSVDTLDGTGPGAGTSLLELRNTRDAFLGRSRAPQGTDVYLTVSGVRSADIALVGNELSRATSAVATTHGAAPDSVVSDGNLVGR